MTMDLISMLAVGVLAFCIVFALNHLTGKRLPKWTLPASIGLAMIAFSVWNEYSWFPRVRAELPPEVAVLRTGADSAPWRPWTYLAPITTRFIALDQRQVLHSEQHPDLVAAEIMLVQRWTPTRRVPVAFDCAAHARADLIEGAAMTPEGDVRNAVWVPLPADDAALMAACRKG